MKRTKGIIFVITLLILVWGGSIFAENPAGVSPGSGENGPIGPLALEGANNTFFGLEAGLAISGGGSGTTDTFIGRAAGRDTTAGTGNTFVGHNAGILNTIGNSNTFLGSEAGPINTNGHDNTLLGYRAGYSNTTGSYNTFVGSFAGRQSTGSENVFIGNRAGFYETNSNRLYIDSSDTTTPLIYGEFDNNKLTINGNLEVIGPDNGLVRLSDVTTDITTKVSRIVLRHYSNAQLPVYLFGGASTATGNFVAFGGGNTIGNAATQLDLFTAPNTTTPTGIPRLTIIGNGYVGIGTQTPSQPLHMASGAHVTVGGAWTNASSREYKHNIESLSTEEAFGTLRELNPVKFAYKSDRNEKHVGFIAEEVPDLIATKDRKGLSPMDIVAVLTKVVQEQEKQIQEQQQVIKEQRETFEQQISTLMEELREIKREMRLRGSMAMSGVSSD